MKTYLALTALALLASPTWAQHWDGNPEMAQSVLNSHEPHFPHVAGDSHIARVGDGSIYDFDLRQGHLPHTAGDSHEATAVPDSEFAGGLIGKDRR